MTVGAGVTVGLARIVLLGVNIFVVGDPVRGVRGAVACTVRRVQHLHLFVLEVLAVSVSPHGHDAHLHFLKAAAVSVWSTTRHAQRPFLLYLCRHHVAVLPVLANSAEVSMPRGVTARDSVSERVTLSSPG